MEGEHARAQAAHFDAEDDEFETERPRGTTPLYAWLIEEKFRRSIEGIGAYVAGCTALAVCAGSGMDAELLARAGRARRLGRHLARRFPARPRASAGGTGST